MTGGARDAARRRAAGAFLWSDRGRILTVTSQLRERGGILECLMRGGSMGRAVPAGSRITIRPGAAPVYASGEVVAFLDGRQIMVHRVAYRGRGRARGHLLTRGDARLLPDLPVAVESVLGRVVEVDTGARRFTPGPPAPRTLGRRALGVSALTLVALALELDVTAGRWLIRTLDAAKRAGIAAVNEALSLDEKRRLGARIFDGHPGGAPQSLAPWEESWLRRRLPPPPARILAVGTSRTRVTVALASRGFEVDSMETCSTERLSGRRYDAVVLGRRSVDHLVDSTVRANFFRAINRVCPDGPLLVTLVSTEHLKRQPRTTGADERWGAACGAVLARLRGVAARSGARQRFFTHYGFAHDFAVADVAATAASLRREVVWEEAPSPLPCVTFLSPGRPDTDR